MRTLTTDVAIIGAGSAGLNARRAVSDAGKNWLLIEGGSYGSTCARTGCMPSKLLIAAADAAYRARRAGLFGIQIAPEAIKVDGRAVFERVRRERDRFVDLLTRDVEALPAEQRIHGYARFVGPTELAVGDDLRVQARAIVIAAGSRPIVPRELEVLGDELLTSDNLFELETVPDSVAVFGTGAIGLELGQSLAHLGARVAFFNPNDVLGTFTDPVVAERFRAVMSADLDLSLGIQVTDVRKEGDGWVIRQREAATGRQKERRFTHVLAAVGRKPSLEKLHLDQSGLKLDHTGVPAFSRTSTQCGSAPVFLAGDVDGFRTILHESADEGAIAGANACSFPSVREHPRRTALNIGFTYPQLAMVGATFKEASEQGACIGQVSYDDQGRARVIGQNRGHVRVYADRSSKKLIGAEMFGPAVEHTAHLLAWAIQQGQTVQQLLRMPVYHPTLEEGIRTALRDVGKELDVIKECLPEDKCSSAGG